MAAESAETRPPDEASVGELKASAAAGPPFGPAFFVTVLEDRVRAECDGNPEAVPVVDLHLADGAKLDLCHIPSVQPQWLAAQVYRDVETCEDMDLMFVPYGLVTRVTVSMWHPSQRRIGFRLKEN